MLKLVFYTQERSLKVRLATAEDSFTHSHSWKNKLNFIISSSSDFMMAWTSLLPDLKPEYAEVLVDLVSARYPISPSYYELNKICPKLSYDNGHEEWVFFGGTFNPWHQGHLSCLNLLPDDLPCLIIPDRNPQKDLREVNPVSTILEISTKAKFKKNQFLIPTFLLEHKKNPTVNWVEKLKIDFPQLKVSLLMGFDSFLQLKTWIRAEDLLKNITTLYVVSRLEEAEDRRLALDTVKSLAPELNVVFLGKHDYEGLSSTEIRNKR